ncbi:MAG TPA: hypothetical protein VMV47_15075 [Bacteroidales bacterium]|nr:hypothetical protein [Bacteroidales bacterium]
MITIIKHLTLLICLTISSSSFCQTNPPRLNWLNLGVGGFNDNSYTGPTDSNGGVSLFLSVNFLRPITTKTQGEKNILNHGFEFRFLNHFMTINESHWMNYYDTDLLYELSFGRYVRFNVSGGIGLLKYDEEVIIFPTPPYTTIPYSKYEKHYTANFPFEAGINLNLLKGFGLGVGYFANLNGKKNVNGFFFNLAFGRLRYS